MRESLFHKLEPQEGGVGYPSAAHCPCAGNRAQTFPKRLGRFSCGLCAAKGH